MTDELSITIDITFKALIPPLADEEFALLEANLIADGCRDPLIIWQERSTLLDGHNRLEICQRHGLDYPTKLLSFASYDHAINWVINNQLGRRNLHPDQASYLRGRRYNIEKKDHGGDRKSEELKSKGQNVPLINTSDRLAAEYKVNPKTIKRDGQYTAAVDVLAGAGFDPQALIAHESKSSIVEFARAIAPIPEPDPESVTETTGSLFQSVAAPTVKKPSPKTVAKLIEQVKSGELTLADAAKKVAPPHNHRAQGTGENEWYTPVEYIEAARAVLGIIDLDPASSVLANETVGAVQFFTADDNGLEQEWTGAVWMNPPYSQPAIAQFAHKLVTEYAAGKVNAAIALTHNYTDTAWFHQLANACAAICFTRGRIGFVNPEGKKAAPTQGQAFFYFGTESTEFARAFADMGFVVEVRNV